MSIHRSSPTLGVLAVVLAASANGCKDPASAAPASGVVSIGTYTSPPVGAVNNFWVETRSGIVVIDGQRVISEGAKSFAALSALGKPILGIFLTHAHPDHYGGLGALAEKAPGAPIYASQSTHDIIAADLLGYSKATAAGSGPDFPSTPVVPTTIVHDGERIEIDGVTFETQELGAGEANGMTAIVLPVHKVAFVGDAISDRVTPALIQGMSLSWLGQLDVVESRLGALTVLYLGHGAPGAPRELVAREREYLQTFRRTVAEHMSPEGVVTVDGNAAIAAAMQSRFPDYPPVASLPDLMRVNVAATARELAALGALPVK